jgi:zinc finger protein
VGLDVAEVEYEVENFGPVIMSVTSCISCGFKHTDVLSLSTHDPTVTSLKLTSAEDLKIRIVRGSTATILVPELGVTIQPGQNNEGFISNVEGVLVMIEEVLRFLSRSLEGQKKQRADSVLSKVEKAREGRSRFTLILKDPSGNSTIASEKAKKRKMNVRELNRLKFGEHAIATRKRS